MELSDLKALYAAMLASPHLLAVFRLDACVLFKTIVRRTLPDDHPGPMLSYMRLYKACLDQSLDGSRQALEKDGVKSKTGVIGSLEVVLKDMPTSIVFRTLAQATRIHDLAHFILRSKLDYLPNLRYERLADPSFTYNRHKRSSQQTPNGIPMNIPSRLSDLSWIEKNRAVRALWLLVVRCRGSGSFNPDGQSSAKEWTCAELPWMDDEVAEVETSLKYGPTSLPPCSASEQARSLSDILRPNPIPQPPYRRNAPTFPSPCFSQSPVTMPNASARSTAWEQDISYLSKENRTRRHLEDHNNYFDCPLQGFRPSVFARLGFNSWDRRRVSAELQLRAIPVRLRPRPLDGQTYRKGEPG
jgi:hypothetical protein